MKNAVLMLILPPSCRVLDHYVITLSRVLAVSSEWCGDEKMIQEADNARLDESAGAKRLPITFTQFPPHLRNAQRNKK